MEIMFKERYIFTNIIITICWLVGDGVTKRSKNEEMIWVYYKWEIQWQSLRGKYSVQMVVKVKVLKEWFLSGWKFRQSFS